jgi:hypothetical protein
LRNLTKKGVAQDCPATGAGAKAAHASIGRALEEGQMVFFTFKGASTRAGGEPFVFETRPSPQGALPAGTTMRQDYDAFRANYKVIDPPEKFEGAMQIRSGAQKDKYLASLSLLQALYADKARIVLMRLQVRGDGRGWGGGVIHPVYSVYGVYGVNSVYGVYRYMNGALQHEWCMCAMCNMGVGPFMNVQCAI